MCTGLRTTMAGFSRGMEISFTEYILTTLNVTIGSALGDELDDLENSETNKSRS